MALKKPAEYFRKTTKIQEAIETPEDTPLVNSFDSFKNVLGKIEVYNQFSGTLEEYNQNVEKVTILAEQINGIQEEIAKLLKREDLENAMLAQLLVVDESIKQVQENVKSLNERQLKDVKQSVANIEESVQEFLETDVPKYKKLVFESESRLQGQYSALEENLETSLDAIGSYVTEQYNSLTETLESINEKSITTILEDFNNLRAIVERDIPKYKKFIVENELKTDSKLKEYDAKLSESVATVLEKIHSIDNLNEESRVEVQSKISDLITLKNQVDEQIKILQEKENQDNRRVAKLEASIVVNESHLKKQSASIRDIEDGKKEILKKVKTLEESVRLNETRIKTQNSSLKSIQENISQTISKLQLEKLEEKNHQLSKKIKYLEEIFQKFNEQTLTEGLLNEPPEIKTSDPITPLDKNFVTLDQLQNHYRQFINRVQQQLATLGGGGETRLKYLDDIVGIATNASTYDNKYLKYNHNLEKFEFDVPNPNKPFPVGDYGNLLNNVQDAFGISLGVTYDCLIYPEEILETVDLGAV